MRLSEVQSSLEKHFSELARARAGSDWPLFALEHGLDDTERAEMEALLCETIRKAEPLDPYWLNIVVFATEHGYDYTGGVYWQPIEDLTHPWDLWQRRQLRIWFKRFQSTYNGVTPSGPWAESFSIIAWPITHAILPSFLRVEFARTLYELRYELARAETLAPGAIGALLSDNAWHATSRFREFLQQEELVGRLALALMTEREIAGDSPIYIPTLGRLVEGLNQLRSSRLWLRETQAAVRDRFKGASQGQATGVRPSAVRSEIPSTKPDITPQLMLRPSGKDIWSVVLELPSLASIGAIAPALRQFIKSTRCRVRGSDAWLPMGWLAAHAQRRVLKSWPGAGQAVLAFERPNAAIEQLLGAELRIATGKSWLCRVNADGVAREVRTGVVRPGGRYIYLTETPVVPIPAVASVCAIECEGIHGLDLRIPAQVDGSLHAALKTLGLQCARTVRIRPVGLTARNWDGEGNSTWLVSDNACFAIEHDHAVQRLQIALDDAQPREVVPAQIGEPTLIRLPKLPVGRHTLKVIAERDRGYAQANLEGVLLLDVREPRPFVPLTTGFSGLVVSVEPIDPTLDDVWDASLQLIVLGPHGYQAQASITFANADGDVLHTERVGPFELPLTAEAWQRALRNLTKDDALAWSCVGARSATIAIDAEELGAHKILLERSQHSLHWIARTSEAGINLKLLDDSGAEGEPDCHVLTFASPAVPKAISSDDARKGIGLTPPGGMFCARQPGVVDEFVVSAPNDGGDFRGLAVQAQISVDATSESLAGLLQMYGRWQSARVASPLASLRRGHVLMHIIEQVHKVLCGGQWVFAEREYLNDKSTEHLQRLERLVAREPGFAVSLRRNHTNMDKDIEKGAQWFADTAKLYRVCDDPALARFALQVASAPGLLSDWELDALPKPIEQLRGNGPLIRGARLVAVLAAERNPQDLALPRWAW